MLRKLLLGSLVLLLTVPTFTTSSFAESTDVTVRVLSKGAKFVGTSMGGVLITLRNADTSELLAEGVTAGGTGDTQRIMIDRHDRHGVRATDGSAQFTASLDIDDPVRLEVTAFGPLGQRQAAATVSATQWVVPGKPINGGDGFLLELPGLIVDVLAPAAHSVHATSGAVAGEGASPLTLQVDANVTMMCGCPLTPGGLWDTETFEVRARVKHNGERKPALDFDLTYAGSASQFSGQLQATEGGVYEITVYGYQAENGNTGLDTVTVIVR